MPSIKKLEYERLLSAAQNGAENVLLKERIKILEETNCDLRNSLIEYDNARRVAADLRRAMQSQILRYQQMEAMLKAYQNLVLDWHTLNINPPVLLTDYEKVDIPACLKPVDSIKYLFRNEPNELEEFFKEKKNGPNHTPPLMS